MMVCGRAGEGRGRGEAYDCSWYAHAGEFLLVFGAGFGAVICDEDDLFAWRANAVN
jgi:hypothetical protein